MPTTTNEKRTHIIELPNALLLAVVNQSVEELSRQIIAFHEFDHHGSDPSTTRNGLVLYRRRATSHYSSGASRKNSWAYVVHRCALDPVRNRANLESGTYVETYTEAWEVWQDRVMRDRH